MAQTQTRSHPADRTSAPARWTRPRGRMSGGEPGEGDESRLLMLAESIGQMGHWRWNITTGELTWSDQVFEIYGVDPETYPVSFESAMASCHPDDRDDVLRALDEAIATRAAFEFDCRIQARAGTRTLICKGQPEIDANGAVVAFFGVVADVTDAFAAIRAIHDQKEMLGLAAHLAHLGHWIWSEDEHRLAFCSEELARIHDLTPDAMERYRHPKHLAAAVLPADRSRYLAAIDDAIAAPRAYEIEYQLQSAGGALKHIREIGQPIVDDHGKLRRFIATVQDISEAKRREQELARAQEELKRRTAELQDSNRQKDKLFSVVAHDLRSPFNTVMGFAEMLAAGAPTLPREKVVGYAELVRNSAGDVQRLLENLLTWASIQIREGGVKIEPICLRRISERSLEPLMHMAEEKRIAIVNRIEETRASGDADLICIVLRNLLSNGIKFSRPGGTVELSAAPAAEGGMVRVTVRDDGVGMSQTATANLFALKCATSETGTLGEKGTGLGLYLCRDIVDHHGGELTVESGAGTGTSIHFTLPISSP